MKILAFLNSYTTGKSGGDMCFIETYRRMEGIDLTVVTSHLGKELCEEYHLKAKFVLTTKEKYFKNIIFTYVKRLWAGINVIKAETDYDIVYSTSDALPDVLPTIFFKLRNTNTKLVVKIFHIIPNKRFFSSFAQQISHFLLKIYADLIIVDNKQLINTLSTSGFSQSKIHHIYPAVDTVRLQSIKPNKRYTATYLGRLHPSKGLEDLIAIWEDIIKQHNNAVLAIIGTGDKDYEERLKSIILKKNLSKNIVLLGYVEDDEAYRLIKGSNMFLFPSHEEGFGMVVAEALALEIPVIAYDLPVFQELFYPALITVLQFNKEHFSGVILDVLKNPKKYGRVIAKGKEIASQYSWEKAVMKEKELLRSLF